MQGSLPTIQTPLVLLIENVPGNALTRLHRCSQRSPTQMAPTSSGHERACKRWVCGSRGARRDPNVLVLIEMRSEYFIATSCRSQA